MNSEYMTHTIKHLKELLRKRGVKGYSGCNKAELEKMCRDYECMPVEMSMVVMKDKRKSKK